MGSINGLPTTAGATASNSGHIPLKFHFHREYATATKSSEEMNDLHTHCQIKLIVLYRFIRLQVKLGNKRAMENLLGLDGSRIILITVLGIYKDVRTDKNE